MARRRWIPSLSVGNSSVGARLTQVLCKLNNAVTLRVQESYIVILVSCWFQEQPQTPTSSPSMKTTQRMSNAVANALGAQRCANDQPAEERLVP